VLSDELVRRRYTGKLPVLH